MATTTTPGRPTPENASENPPIYDDLVQEHGDVLAASRKAAQSTQIEAEEALDWSDLHPVTDAEDE